MKITEHNGRLTAFFKPCREPSDCVYNSKEDMKKFCAKDCPFLVLLLCLFLIGCKTPKTVTSTNHEQKTEIESFDSIITTPADSATASLLIRCDSLGNAYLAELHTEQGKRIRAELLLKNAQSQLDSLGNLKPQVIYKNQPLLIQVDCKEDSLQQIVHALRERISQYEKNDTLRTEYVKYVPDYYKNTSKGFWWLLGFAILVVAWAVMSYIPQTRPIKKTIRAFLHL